MLDLWQINKDTKVVCTEKVSALDDTWQLVYLYKNSVYTVLKITPTGMIVLKEFPTVEIDPCYLELFNDDVPKEVLGCGHLKKYHQKYMTFNFWYCPDCKKEV